MYEYDEDKAVAFINERLKAAGRNTYDADEMLNAIDMIWDCYESNGNLNLSVNDEQDDVEPDEIVKYVKHMLAKDKLSPIAIEDVEAIVEAELEYEAQCGI